MESSLACALPKSADVSRKKGFDTDLDLQLLHKKLEARPKRLREKPPNLDMVLQQGGRQDSPWRAWIYVKRESLFLGT